MGSKLQLQRIGIDSRDIYPPHNFPHIKAKSNEPGKMSLKGQAWV